MATSENHCRRVSYIQLEALCKILNGHRDVAMGYNKSAKARNHSRKVWEMAAQTLNSLEDNGATKNWRGWATYWVDYKAKLKRKLLALQRSHAQTEGSLSRELDNIQIKFLNVLGHDFGLGLTEPQVDPFCQVMVSDDPVASATVNGERSPSETLETPLLEVKEEPTLPPDFTEASDSMKVREPAISLGSTRAAGLRRRRAGALYSQQRARHLLVQSSRARLRYARQNVNAMNGMYKALLRIARCLEEIKKSLCSQTNV